MNHRGKVFKILLYVLAAAAAGLDLDLDDHVERSGGLSLDAPGEAPPAGKAAPACGIVADLRCRVMIRVRRPRTTHARYDHRIAFAIPAHVAAIPYFQPNCPA